MGARVFDLDDGMPAPHRAVMMASGSPDLSDSLPACPRPESVGMPSCWQCAGRGGAIHCP